MYGYLAYGTLLGCSRACESLRSFARGDAMHRHRRSLLPWQQI